MTTHFTGCASAATDSERPCVDLRSRGDTASTVFSGARVGAILVDSPEAAGWIRGRFASALLANLRVVWIASIVHLCVMEMQETPNTMLLLIGFRSHFQEL